MYTPKQLASKRNVIKAHQAKKMKRKNYFKKKVQNSQIEVDDIVDVVELGKEKIVQDFNNLIYHMKFSEIAQNQISYHQEAQSIEEKQKQAQEKIVSQLTKKRRQNKEKRIMMEQHDEYRPEKSGFAKKQVIQFARNEYFLSEKVKQKFVYGLRRTQIDKIKQFIRKNISNFQMMYILGIPGTGKTTSVLLALDEAGIKEADMILVHSLHAKNWRQTLLRCIGVKTSAPNAVKIFQKYMVGIKIVIFDEFDWMNEKMIDQMISVFETLKILLIFIGCGRQTLQCLSEGSLSRFKFNQLLFAQYNDQSIRTIISQLFPQLSTQQLYSMTASFLLRSRDLRKMIDFIQQNKDNISRQENVIREKLKQSVEKYSYSFDFRNILKKQCQQDVLMSYIIFMISKRTKNKITLPELAQPVQQNFTRQEILAKCTTMAESGLLTCQFRIRNHNSCRDWKKQQFTPTWHFQFSQHLSEIVKQFHIINFKWTDVLPFSSKYKRIPIDESDYPEPTTPINQTPINNLDSDVISESQGESSEQDLIFSSDNSHDSIHEPKECDPIVKVKPDRYAGLDKTYRYLAYVQERKRELRLQKMNQEVVNPYKPKPRHLRGKPIQQEPQPKLFEGWHARILKQ